MTKNLDTFLSVVFHRQMPSCFCVCVCVRVCVFVCVCVPQCKVMQTLSVFSPWYMTLFCRLAYPLELSLNASALSPAFNLHSIFCTHDWLTWAKNVLNKCCICFIFEPVNVCQNVINEKDYCSLIFFGFFFCYMFLGVNNISKPDSQVTPFTLFL